MGEAKRRKKLDPTFGIYNPEFTIAESPKTNNFLVLIDGYCVDSSIHLHEAEAIKEWLEAEHRVNPIQRCQVASGRLHPWIVNSKRYADYPQTTAEVWAYQPSTGRYETRLFTV